MVEGVVGVGHVGIDPVVPCGEGARKTEVPEVLAGKVPVEVVVVGAVVGVAVLEWGHGG